MSLFRSKGYKVTVDQTLWIFQLPGTGPRATLEWFDSGHAAEFFSNLQRCQLVILHPFNLQRPTVPHLKDLNFLKSIHLTHLTALFKDLLTETKCVSVTQPSRLSVPVSVQMLPLCLKKQNA